MSVISSIPSLKNVSIGSLPSIDSINKGVNDPSVFKNFFNSAMTTLGETNALQKQADQMSVDFALGKIESVHDVMIAQEKASIALQYTVAVRGKLLEAYNEIMRIQL